MEIKWLTSEHYDQLLELLNYTFGNKYKRPMDFIATQPKMWVRDDEHMGCHIGAFDDGRLCAVVGVYPLHTVIDGTPFLFATTGNVATHPDYEGRGLFNTLFTEAVRRVEQMDVDVSRLGGARQRYGRFGYEGCGTEIIFSFEEKNRIRCFGNAGEDLSFSPIGEADTEALAFCRELRMRETIYVERSPKNNYRDVYLSLRSKQNRPFLVSRNGMPVGYLTATESKKELGELGAPDTQTLRDIICGWQRLCGQTVTFSLPPYQTEAVRLFCKTAESFRTTYPTRFRIRNWQKLTDVLLRLAAKTRPLLDGQFILGIEGYGNIRLTVRDGNTSCEKSDEDADLTLDALAAARLLFGPCPPETVADLPPVPGSWLPLPLGWCALDAI